MSVVRSQRTRSRRSLHVLAASSLFVVAVVVACGNSGDNPSTPDGPEDDSGRNDSRGSDPDPRETGIPAADSGEDAVSDAGACGVFGDGGDSGSSTFTVAGSVIGLTGAGLVLQNNGGDNRAISSNGCFAFTTALDGGASYNVTILSQPSGQTCTVFNGSGTSGPRVPSLVVTCDRSPLALATGQKNPVGIAVDKNNVYWTDQYGGGVNGRAVMKKALDGGSPIMLASGTSPTQLAVDDTYVYWTDQAGGAGVKKTPIAGGTTIPLVQGDFGGQPYQAAAIAIDKNNVYFTSTYGPTTGLVMSVPKDGGAPVVIATGQPYPNTGIAVDATNVYWTNNGRNPLYKDSAVMTAPISGVPDGGAPKVLAAYPFVYAPNQVTVDATNIYWTNSSGTVMKARKDGSCLVELASGQLPPWGITVDSTHVYWTNEGYTQGSVMKVPIAGGCVVGLAVGNNLLGITVDSTNVYWVDQGPGTNVVGSVWTVSKN